LRLELKHRVGMRRWLGAGCALALACACAAPALAQQPAASNPSASTSSNVAKAHPAASSHPKPKTAASASSKSKHTASHRSGKRKVTARGQQKIEPQRAQEIQEALIREHYLSGEASGTWTQSSEDAMRRYQADHGWQSKTVPDSRALISLGLGPSHDHLLNPESAMTMGPFPTRSESLSSSTQTPVSHSADPGVSMKKSPTPPAAPTPAPTPDHDTPSPQ
jgi:hypothetical protein